MSLAHTSHVRIEKHEGPHRTAHIENFEDPINFGIHGGIKHFYQEKYGREISGPEYPATLDHIIAGVAGWLTGTLGTALDARGIKSAENLVSNVEGDIEDVDGILKITKIRLKYNFKIPSGTREKAERALAVFADACPAYQTVRDVIDCSWDAEMEEV